MSEQYNMGLLIRAMDIDVGDKQNIGSLLTCSLRDLPYTGQLLQTMYAHNHFSAMNLELCSIS